MSHEYNDLVEIKLKIIRTNDRCTPRIIVVYKAQYLSKKILLVNNNIIKYNIIRDVNPSDDRRRLKIEYHY